MTLTPVDDTAVEGSETATLTVASGSGYTVGTPSSASGSIADNDAATPSLSIQSPVSITEGRSGTTNVTLTVTLAGRFDADGDGAVRDRERDGDCRLRLRGEDAARSRSRRA